MAEHRPENCNHSTGPSTQLEQMFLTWQQHRQEGRSVTPEELCAEQPELLTGLVQLIELNQEIGKDTETFSDRDIPAEFPLEPPPLVSFPTDPPPWSSPTREPSPNPDTKEIHQQAGDASDYSLIPVTKEHTPPAETKELPRNETTPTDHSLIHLSNWDHGETREEAGGETLEHSVSAPYSDFNSQVEIPGYEILRELGRGGMGVVYQARHLQLQRVVALKMILAGAHAGSTELARFRTEAEAVARLQHPGIVQIYEIGEHQGLPFFSLEFCSGGALDDKLSGTPMHPGEAAILVQQIAQAMHAAHEANVIHRDLKPANILLDAREFPKITDFGLAKKLDEAGQTQDGSIMGTPSYMAPEQASGEISEIGPSADVYALGAILYDCLTGRPPFRAATAMDTVMQVVQNEPVPPSQLHAKCPRDLETICLKCLSKQPSGRYESAQALSEDLQRYLDGEPIVARPAGKLERLGKWIRRSPARAAACAGVIAFLVATFVAIYSRMEAEKKNATLARKDSALAQQKQELAEKQKALLLRDREKREQELSEQQRLEKLRSRITALYSGAEKLARQASDNDPDVWGSIKQDVSSALSLISSEQAFSDFPLKEPLQRLNAQAQRVLADAKEREGHRQRLAQLKEHHSDAVFFSTLSSGVEQQEGQPQAREAVAQGLSLFVDKNDPSSLPVLDSLYTPREAEYVLATLYELLLIEAEMLATPQIGEQAQDWRGRLSKALALLDRADKLPLPVRPKVGLVRRVKYLKGLKQNEKAENAQKLADATAPSLAVDFFLLGMEHYGAGKFEEALKPLASAQRLQPNHYGVEYLLATCRLKQQRWETAKAGFSRCLQQRPDFPWPHIPRGYAEMMLGNVEEALADFQVVLDDPPDDTARYVALVNRGVLRMQRKQWQLAISDLRTAIQTKPDSLPAYVNLALTLRQRSEIPRWKQGVMLLAPSTATSALVVEAHRRQGKLDAIAVLSEALDRQTRDLPPEDQVSRASVLSPLYRERGRLHRQVEQLKEAQQDLARAVAFGTLATVAEDLLDLGQILHQRNRHAEAVKAYQSVLKVKPDHVLAQRLLAEPLLSLKRYEEAGRALDRYLEKVPVASAERVPTPKEAARLIRAFKARGLLHSKQGNFRSALESYTQALKIQRDPETLSLRGWAYLTKYESWELARLDFEEALKSRPRYSDALLGRSYALVTLGRIQDAVADVEAGLRAGTGTSLTLYNAARTYSRATEYLRDPQNATRVETGSATQYEQRAIQLIEQALAKTPPAQRAAFWKKIVEMDRALAPVQQHPRMQSLKAGFAGQGQPRID